MRRLSPVGLLLALVMGCQPSPGGGAASRPWSQGDGKIPITTRSQEARAAYLRGRGYNENLQTHEAHLQFQQAVAIDPSFALGEYGIAITSPTARDVAEHLEKALALASEVSAGEQLLIRHFQARSHGDPEGARQLAESLVVRYPQDERAHGTLASTCSAQQLYEQAIVELRKAIALNPRYSLAYNQLGYAHRSTGQLEEAEKAFKQYIALVPNDPNPYDSYAELLMKGGRFDESIAQYRKAHSIDEHFAGSFVGIAANEMLAGRYDAAVGEAKRYLQAARDDGERRTALLTLAMIRIDEGQSPEAHRVMEQRYALASAIGDTVNMSADGVIMAEILLESGKADAARDRFTEAHTLLAASSVSLEVKRDDALASHYDAARVLLAKGDLQGARGEAVAYAAGAAASRNGVRIRQAHELNGLVELSAKRYDAGLAELALADQQNPTVLSAKSRAYAGRGDVSRAQELAKLAEHMNVLPTLPYVFTRASLAAATRSARVGTAGGKTH